MTAPGPHSPPNSRRAARSQRERAVERAPGADGETDTVATRPLPVVESPPLRREARTPPPTPARHARARRAARIGAVFALAAAGSLVMGSAAAVTAAMSGPVVSDTAGAVIQASEKVDASIATETPVPLPAPAASIPAPTVEAAPATVDICAIPAVTAAIAAGDDAGAIAAAGGAEPFRTAVAAGIAPCVPMDDPAHVWVVINKTRPFAPIDYSPTPLAMPQGVRSVEGGSLRTDAADAMTALVGAAAQAGVGEIALESGYRSYETQQTTYGNNVGNEGAEQADLSSARPGFSEHQSGLAADVVGCGEGCGTLDDLAATPQGQWIAAHAWEYGWVTRYVDGATAVSGYVAEPWHLRYIGPELARAYHDGGWTTLEQFFGLPAAPDYLG
ncbi:MAG: M15 family metallopeptidase [Microbacterium pygmaeum]